MAPKKEEKMTEYERKRLENIRRNQERMESLNIHSALFHRKEQSLLMAPKRKKKEKEKMTEYERKRMENIRRNQERMASLNIRSALSWLSSTKCPGVDESSKKRPKSPSHTVIRRSLRGRGMPPDSKGLFDASNRESVPAQPRSPEGAWFLGPYPMRDAYCGLSGSDQSLIDAILSVEAGGQVGGEKGVKLELESVRLESKHVASAVSGSITTVKFFPRNDLRMIVAGSKSGSIVFWNVDYKEKNGGKDKDGIYLYHPHIAPVSSVLFHQACSSKIFTSSYDGFVRLMDAEKEVFDLVYSSEDAIGALTHNPNAMNSLCFAEGHGGLSVLDDRAGKSSSNWMLHGARINSIDFNSQNPHMMLTSSTDGTACIWDLRNVNADKPNSLKTISHQRAVYSAYFSPSGSMLATTSIDNTVGLVSGINFEDAAMVDHYNQGHYDRTKTLLSTSRAVWGWDDSVVFIGNIGSKIDVISAAERRVFTSLECFTRSAIPCRLEPHPFHVGMLAVTTISGLVCIWTAS